MRKTVARISTKYHKPFDPKSKALYSTQSKRRYTQKTSTLKNYR